MSVVSENSRSTEHGGGVLWANFPKPETRESSRARQGSAEASKLKINMKLTKTLIVGMFAFALIAAPAFAETCCEKAKKDGKDCAHKCCVDAKKDGKTCEKCAEKTDKKEDKK
jgi:hypothetical protein